jgi:hypothetical protein
MTTHWASSQFVSRVDIFVGEPVLDITFARTVRKCTTRKTRNQTRKHQAHHPTPTPTMITAAYKMNSGTDKTP